MAAVGDEGVAAAGRDRGVARRPEAAEHAADPHRPVLEERDAPHGRMGDDRDAARARLDAPRVLHGADARGHTRPREVDRDDMRLGVRGHQREPGPRGDGLRAHQRRHARQGQGAKPEAEKGAAIHAFWREVRVQFHQLEPRLQELPLVPPGR